MPGSRGSEADREWGSLLEELGEYHQQAEEELRQQHWEEIKRAGLSPDRSSLNKDGALFSREELQQHLASLGAELRQAGSSFHTEAAQETSVSWGRGK